MMMASWHRRVGGPLLAAIRFLTVVPVPGPAEDARAFGAMVFPLVGLGIGFATWLCDQALSIAPFELRNIGIATFLIFVSGGLHHDGLADMLDGLGGRTLEDRLRIMKESTVGTYAVLGLLIGFVTKLSALALLGEETRAQALLLAPVLARWALVAAAWRARPARPDGLGARFTTSLEGADVGIASALALLLALALGGESGLLAVVAAAVIAAGVRTLAQQRFGGTTGDVLGAAGEIAETVVLAFLASRSEL